MASRPTPTYSLGERDRRWSVARTFMDKEGLDALLVFGDHEDAGPAAAAFDNWITNSRPGSIVVVPRTGQPLELVPFSLSIIDHMESSRQGHTMWIEPKDIRVGRDAGVLESALNELKLAKSTIGVVGLEPLIPWHPDGIVPYGLWSKILSLFPEAIFKPVAAGFMKLMMTLSDEEIVVLRHASDIGGAMAQAMVETARPGVLESEVYSAGMAAAYRRGTIVPWMHFYCAPEPLVSGPPWWAYRPQAPRMIQGGDVIRTEIFCNFGMRTTQHQLTVAIGEVDKDIERAAVVARACYDAGLRALKPKVRFGDVCLAMLRPVEEAGVWARGPQIHGLNPMASFCSYQLDLSTLDERYHQTQKTPIILGDLELEAGMTFAFEPSCGFGRKLVTVGGVVIVGEDGAIELNPYTSNLHRVN